MCGTKRKKGAMQKPGASNADVKTKLRDEQSHVHIQVTHPLHDHHMVTMIMVPSPSVKSYHLTAGSDSDTEPHR